MHTVSGPFLIAPFVGLIEVPPGARARPARGRAGLRRRALGAARATRCYHEELWQPLRRGTRSMHFFELADETVWGATARILAGFLAHLMRVACRARCDRRLVQRGDRGRAVGSFLCRRLRVEVEIGIGKSGRRAYGFDDIAIVPSRRTRDPEDVDISWELDAFQFELPVIAAAMDGVRVARAPRSSVGNLGGLALPQPRRPVDALRRSRAALRGDRGARRSRRPRAGCRRSTPSRSRTSSSGAASARSRTPASRRARRSRRSGSSSTRSTCSRPSSTSS